MCDRYQFFETEQVKNDIETVLEYWSRHYGEKSAYKLDGAIEVIEEHIEYWPFAAREVDGFPGIRKKTVSKDYPFAFYYRIDNDKLTVIAFAFESNRRDPDYIKSLLEERLAGASEE